MEFEKKVVFFFGRCNPPTKGHEKAFNKVFEVAAERSAQPLLFVSQTQNKKNPIPYSIKASLMESWYGKSFVYDEDKSFITAFHVCEQLSNAGVEEVTMVVGSDRIDEFHDSIGRYVGTKYKFKFDVVSSGNRLCESEDITETISGSQLREHAEADNFKSFQAGLISRATLAQAKFIFEAVKGNIDEASIPVISTVTKSSKIPYGLLKKVFDRQSNGKPFKQMTTKEIRAAMKRVLSYARGGKFRSVDSDLSKVYRRKKNRQSKIKTRK